jgi:hypothetical protein
MVAWIMTVLEKKMDWEKEKEAEKKKEWKVKEEERVHYRGRGSETMEGEKSTRPEDMETRVKKNWEIDISIVLLCRRKRRRVRRRWVISLPCPRCRPTVWPPSHRLCGAVYWRPNTQVQQRHSTQPYSDPIS